LGGALMSDERERNRYRNRGCGGCGLRGGCASVAVVLTVGLVLTIFGTAVGIGGSVRVPFTDSNLTIAGSVGKKEKAVGALPAYVQDKVASSQNLINQTNTLTIWVAEGIVVIVVGHQEGAPSIDLHLEAR
jgi:hypothetical protein